MEQKLYDQMDWAGIEELVYSEASDPHRLLGPHVTEDGLLIQAFIPGAQSITVKLTGNGKEISDGAGGRGRLFCRAGSEKDRGSVYASCYL